MWMSSCKVPLILVRFWLISNISRKIFEKFHENLSSEKPSSIRTHRRTVGRADTRTVRRIDSRTDGQTDMMKLIVAFHSFTKSAKKIVRALETLSALSTSTCVCWTVNRHYTSLQSVSFISCMSAALALHPLYSVTTSYSLNFMTEKYLKINYTLSPVPS